MFLSRCKPQNSVWHELQRLHEEMNRRFDRANVLRTSATDSTSSFPALNVWDDGDSVQAEAELPGMDINFLEIYVTGRNQLTIKGERTPPVSENTKWHRRERGFGSFSRTVTLPILVDEERVSATLTHGVLKVTMPKAPELKPRRIPLNAE